MRFSTLSEVGTSRSYVEVYGGYDHNDRIPDGSFYDMRNMSSSKYPVLTPRPKRGTYQLPSSTEHSVTGIIAKDNLCYVDGTHLFINNYPVNGLTLSEGPKQLISMAAYLIIMPDKKYVNTKDLTDYGDIEASFTTSSTVTYEMCRADGTGFDPVVTSATEPSDPDNMEYWIDVSQTPHQLKQYSSSTAMWTAIATTYVKIKAAGIASAFKQYDGVKITGIDPEITQLSHLEGQTSVIYESHHDEDGNGAGDYIVMVGFLDAITTQTDPLSIERRMPVMDFIVESNNRLWGCRYGTNAAGDVVNEIYASKLGDFKNWNTFMGSSMDSYVASCGTDGPFTGAITHLGYPLFFKENCLHKVYGNYPANFQIQSTACRGVMRGAGNSLAIVNEAVMYKSRNGICVYDGSLPAEITTVFGNIHYTALDETGSYDPLRCGAAAGCHNNKYYISMKSAEDGLWHLFVYDAIKQLWHKEDNTRADAFCSCGGEMYFIDHETKLIRTVLGSGIQDTEETEWMAETGNLGLDLPDRKYISKIVIRLSLTIGAWVGLYIQYDSSGEWQHVSTMRGTNLRSFSIPIRTHRCDHFKLRIIGKGEASIYSTTKTIEQGSDV